MKTNIIFDHISLISSQNEKCFRQNLCGKSKHTCTFNIFFLNRAFSEKMRKNIVEPDRPQMTI